MSGTRYKGLAVPYKLRKRVVDLAHEGHQGVVKSKQRLRSKVWWPGIERRCKTCYGYQLVSSPGVPEPLRKTRLPERPWQALAVDLLGPLPWGHYLLVLVDCFRKFEIRNIRIGYLRSGEDSCGSWKSRVQR